MEKLIKDQNYGPLAQKLDAVYCATDTIADGVVTALKKAGYSLTTMPFITGRDATLSQLKGIMKGEVVNPRNLKHRSITLITRPSYFF